MAKDLLTPILEGGIKNPHFFEGRLLAGADLRADQEANRARQRQLGRALGAGIVEGLWVEETDPAEDGTPVLRISAGLALNKKGQALELHEGLEVRLAPPTKELPPEAGLFVSCKRPSADQVATGEGIYLLVLSPASGFRERAPMSGLGTGKAGAGCGSRWAVEGVQLRTEPWNPLTTSLTAETREVLVEEGLLTAREGPRLSKLRNVLAHLCLGTDTLASYAADPFAWEDAALDGYGPLDDLTATDRLTDCDVPLALVHWNPGGLSFVDNWAVRRRLMPPASADDWPTLSGGRRRAEAAAAFFQFQDHLGDLLSTVRTAALRADTHFHWLPAAGFVEHPRFFTGGATRGPLWLEGNRLGWVLATARSFPSFRVDDREMVWLYQTPENQGPAADGSTPASQYLLFAGSHVPLFSSARFNIQRFNFAYFSRDH